MSPSFSVCTACCPLRVVSDYRQTDRQILAAAPSHSALRETSSLTETLPVRALDPSTDRLDLRAGQGSGHALVAAPSGVLCQSDCDRGEQRACGTHRSKCKRVDTGFRLGSSLRRSLEHSPAGPEPHAVIHRERAVRRRRPVDRVLPREPAKRQADQRDGAAKRRSASKRGSSESSPVPALHQVLSARRTG